MALLSPDRSVTFKSFILNLHSECLVSKEVAKGLSVPFTSAVFSPGRFSLALCYALSTKEIWAAKRSCVRFYVCACA